MSWLKKLMPSGIRTEGKSKKNMPAGVWQKCTSCKSALWGPELERSVMVCPKCGHHMPIPARQRLQHFLDADSGEELFADLEPVDVLKFKDSKTYRNRIAAAQKATGERDALVVMAGTLLGRPVVASAFDFRFMGGSMGSVVGERFARAATRAREQREPLINFSATGGARMQESLFSLMQMAKTSAALARLAEAGIPFVSVLTHPTTGGVSASLGMLGDINIGEPGALIGFAGPRVIEQTVGETLPEGFQRSEFLLSHGALDMIVDRREHRDRIGALLSLLCDGPACPVPDQPEAEVGDGEPDAQPSDEEAVRTTE